MCDAPQEEALERAAADAAEHDEVRARLRSGVRDRVSRAAGADLIRLELDVEAFGPRLGDLIRDLRLNSGSIA